MGWAGATMDGIRASRLMILVFSDEANRSTQILREVERAVNAGIVLLPFRLEDVAPSGDLEYFISAKSLAGRHDTAARGPSGAAGPATSGS
jgi:hypothetical protein